MLLWGDYCLLMGRRAGVVVEETLMVWEAFEVW